MANISGKSKQRKVKNRTPLPRWQLLLTWRLVGVPPLETSVHLLGLEDNLTDSAPGAEQTYS